MTLCLHILTGIPRYSGVVGRGAWGGRGGVGRVRQLQIVFKFPVILLQIVFKFPVRLLVNSVQVSGYTPLAHDASDAKLDSSFRLDYCT